MLECLKRKGICSENNFPVGSYLISNDITLLSPVGSDFVGGHSYQTRSRLTPKKSNADELQTLALGQVNRVTLCVSIYCKPTSLVAQASMISLSAYLQTAKTTSFYSVLCPSYRHDNARGRKSVVRPLMEG